MTASVQRDELRVIVLTALHVERMAVRGHLTDLGERNVRGSIYDVGTFKSQKRHCSVLVVETGPGNDRSAVECERAITSFEPHVALFVGVAGGVKDVAIGDVVASTKIYGYEGGKEKQGRLNPRPQAVPCSHGLIQRANAERANKRWTDRLAESDRLGARVHVGPIAAGEKVLGSTKSSSAQLLKSNYGDALAVDMEGRGFLAAVSSNVGIEALAVRGVSDLLDKKNAAGEDGRQELASRRASAFAFEVLARWLDDLPDVTKEAGTSVLTPPPPQYSQQLRQEVAELGDLAEFGDKLQRALLPSLGAFTVGGTADDLHLELIDRTVLAAIVAEGTTLRVQDLPSHLTRMLNSKVISATDLDLSVGRMAAAGICTLSDGGAVVSIEPETARQMGVALQAIRLAFGQLASDFVRRLSSARTISTADEETCRRNFRRALVSLVRATGPTDWAENLSGTERLAVATHYDDLRSILTRDLQPELHQLSLAALAEVVDEQANRAGLAMVGRSLFASFVRNLDPLARQWQTAQFRRSTLVLDTEVVLMLLIEEVPEHAAIERALRAFSESGVSIRIPRSALQEVQGHFERSVNAYQLFKDRLLTLPREFVDEQVWNMLVRGYYYSTDANGKGRDFHAYRDGYLDPKRPLDYIGRLIGDKIRWEVYEPPALTELGPEDDRAYAALFPELLKLEEKRNKAQYRDTSDMEARVDGDIRCALDVARGLGAESRARGYFVSTDGAFRAMERHHAWPPRSQVRIFTNALPRIAELVCGARLTDEEFVGLVFNPAFAVAADGVATQIDALARVGVALREVKPVRLSWAIEQDLGADIMSFTHESASNEQGEVAEERRTSAVLQLARRSRAAGFQVAGEVAQMLDSFTGLKKKAQEQEQVISKVTDVVWEVAGKDGKTGKKTSRKIEEQLRKAGVPASRARKRKK